MEIYGQKELYVQFARTMDPSLLLPQIVLVLSHLSNRLLGMASSHCTAQSSQDIILGGISPLDAQSDGLSVVLMHGISARSGLVWVFHRAVKKLEGYFESNNSSALPLEACMAQCLYIWWCLTLAPTLVLAAEVPCIDGRQMYQRV